MQIEEVSAQKLFGKAAAEPGVAGLLATGSGKFFVAIATTYGTM
jgi:hypothetical protein